MCVVCVEGLGFVMGLCDRGGRLRNKGEAAAGRRGVERQTVA